MGGGKHLFSSLGFLYSHWPLMSGRFMVSFARAQAFIEKGKVFQKPDNMIMKAQRVSDRSRTQSGRFIFFSKELKFKVSFYVHCSWNHSWCWEKWKSTLYVHKCINNIFYFLEKHLLVQSGMVIIILREKWDYLYSFNCYRISFIELKSPISFGLAICRVKQQSRKRHCGIYGVW